MEQFLNQLEPKWLYIYVYIYMYFYIYIYIYIYVLGNLLVAFRKMNVSQAGYTTIVDKN